MKKLAVALLVCAALGACASLPAELEADLQPPRQSEADNYRKTK